MTTEQKIPLSEHARMLWRCGFNVLPMRMDKKAPALASWDSLKSHYQTEQEIAAHDWRGNVGFINGVNAVRTVDIDGCEGSGDLLVRVLELMGLEFDYPWVAFSPGKGGGWHIHFRCEDLLTLTQGGHLVGYPLAENSFQQMELRWQNCVTMLPPSMHPDAKEAYEWNLLTPAAPLATVSVAAVERMFRDLATTKRPGQGDNDSPETDEPDSTKRLKYDAWTERAFSQEVAKLHKAVNGNRNDQLNRAAFALGQIVGSGLLHEQEVIDELTRAALTIGLEEKEIADSLKSGLEAGKQKPRTPKLVYRDNEAPLKLPTLKQTDDATLCKFSADDQGNAEAVKHFFGPYISYNEAFGWMCWNGTHFAPSIQQINNLIVSVLRRRAHAAKALDREDIGKISTAMAGRVAAARTQLENLCYVDVGEFDNEPDLLNCLNGVVDLRTKKLYKHEPGYHFTWCSPVAYKADARERQDVPWHAFLETTVPNRETREYLIKALGYSITGHISEECLFYIFGPPRSGKGTLTETLLAILPRPIAMEVDFNTFTAKREGDTQNFDLAPLKPARLVFASESNKYQSLNPAKVKALTGGNYISCAFKHKDTFSYQPQYSIWLSSNHDTNADPDDDAIWSRVKCIEFPNSQLGREDRSLKRRMQSPENLECVLACLIEGAYQWYECGAHGLDTPDEVKKQTQAQRAAQDAVGLWLEECCEREAGAWTSNALLMQSYENWCEANGFEAKKAKGFTQSLAAKGYETGERKYASDGKRTRGVTGLKLL